MENSSQNLALKDVSKIVAVASGKGGVGKSSVCVYLARALAAQGKKVGILDADVYGPSVPKMTGVSKPTHMNEELIIPPEADGIKIISAEMFAAEGKAQILRGPLVAQIVKQMLTQVDWANLDVLLIDYPPGTGDIQLSLSQTVSLNGAIVVTTPQEIALHDVRKSIQMFQTLNVPILGIVENMSYLEIEATGEKLQVFPGKGGELLAEQLSCPLLAQIPIDSQLAASCDEGKNLITSATPAMAVFKQIASKLSDLLTQDTQQGMSNFRLEWK